MFEFKRAVLTLPRLLIVVATLMSVTSCSTRKPIIIDRYEDGSARLTTTAIAVGDRVRVETDTGNVFQGRIKAIDNEAIELAIRLGGGTSRYEVTERILWVDVVGLEVEGPLSGRNSALAFLGGMAVTSAAVLAVLYAMLAYALSGLS